MKIIETRNYSTVECNLDKPVTQKHQKNTLTHKRIESQQKYPIHVHAPTSHTYFPHTDNTPSTIDLLVASSSFVLDNIYTWDRYQTHIINGLHDITAPQSQQEVDQAIGQFISLIVSARDMAIPKCKINPDPRKPGADTINAIRDKNNLYRRWRRTTDPIAKSHLKTTINILQILIHQLTIRDRNEAKANALASVFEKAHHITENQTSIFEQEANNCNLNIANNHSPNRRFATTSKTEIEYTIKALRPFKAPGNDSIQNNLLKSLPSEAKCSLTYSTPA